MYEVIHTEAQISDLREGAKARIAARKAALAESKANSDETFTTKPALVEYLDSLVG